MTDRETTLTTFSKTAAFVLFLLAAGMLLGQSQNSSINGTVTDATGAVVPGVELTLTNVQQQSVAKATSTSDGRYTFPNLVPGEYELKATAKGFKPVLQHGLSISVSQVVRVDVSLEVGTDVQAIEVTATPPSSISKTPPRVKA